MGEQWFTANRPTYSNAVARAGGQVDVVGVRRHTAISPGDIGSHVLPDAVNALAGAVRPCETPSDSDQGHSAISQHVTNGGGGLGEGARGAQLALL